MEVVAAGGEGGVERLQFVGEPGQERQRRRV